MRRPAQFLTVSLLAVAAFAASLPAAETPTNTDSVRQLRLEKFVMPEFPDYVRLTGSNRGAVTVAIGRDAEGYVVDVLVLDSTNPRLTQSVQHALAEWRFARPALQAPAGQQIVPIVRFLFNARGVSVVSALTGSLAEKTQSGTPRDDAPIILPSFVDFDSPPKALKQPMPKLRAGSSSGVREGEVTVKFFIDETGRVRVPIVLESPSIELGQAAIAAIAEWRFEPPRLAGKPTIVIETQTFQFKATP